MSRSQFLLLLLLLPTLAVMANAQENNDLIKEIHNCSSFMKDANKCDLQKVKSLIDTSANVNAIVRYDGSEFTALKAAASWGNIDTVRMLIDAKADVNFTSEGSSTPLISAVVSCEFRDRRPHCAEIVRMLIDAKADVNAHGYEGWTALTAAVDDGTSDVVRMLIDAGADLNAKGLGRKALLIASQKGNGDIVRMLIDAKADLNVKDDNGDTALMLASHQGFVYIVQLLIQAKADVKAKDNFGGTALDFAKANDNNVCGGLYPPCGSQMDHAHIILLLKQAGAK